MQTTSRTSFLWLLLAWLCLAIGLVAIVIPGLPTTVFILISAYAASRGSPRLHRWLCDHRLFGPMIRNWENGHCISRKAKNCAALTMLLCFVIMLLTVKQIWITLFAGFCMAGVIAWMWSRPESPTKTRDV